VAEEESMAVALEVRKWTLAEVHRLPDDGNKYELVRGELFVTPPPSVSHEEIAARLSALLTPYVEREGLGQVHHPRAVVRYEGSEVEPDLLVRARHARPTGSDRDWNSALTPILVVEILSPYTRRRDRAEKKSLYMEAGVGEYWIVDPEERTITVVSTAGEKTVRDVMQWAPAAAASALGVRVPELFE
jgi:Uma2 family endonuclease